MQTMANEIGRLNDLRPLCAWPKCERAPEVRVECHARSSNALPGGLPWERVGVGWYITLCNAHATSLAILVGTSAKLSMTKLG